MFANNKDDPFKIQYQICPSVCGTNASGEAQLVRHYRWNHNAQLKTMENPSPPGVHYYHHYEDMDLHIRGYPLFVVLEILQEKNI